MTGRLLKIGLALAAAILVAALGREVAVLLPAFTAWVHSLGVWGPAVFVAGYSLAPVVLAPAFLLTIAAGAIFGLIRGVLFVMIGATIGATLAFLVGRYLARGFVERWLARNPRIAAIDRAVEREGFRLVFLLRMSPVVPYTLLNYALGVSRVRLRDYVPASLGMLPVVAAYVYSGKLAGDLASIASGVAAPRGPVYYTLIALGFAATVAVTVIATRMARRAIDDQLQDSIKEPER